MPSSNYILSFMEFHYVHFLKLVHELEWSQNLRNIQTDVRQTDIQKLVKPYLRHLKTCKSINNWKPKTFRNPTFPLFEYKRSKNNNILLHCIKKNNYIN